MSYDFVLNHGSNKLQQSQRWVDGQFCLKSPQFLLIPFPRLSALPCSFYVEDCCPEAAHSLGSADHISAII